MIRRLASFLVLAGFIGFIYTGINYINNTESFSFLGADWIISKGDPTGMVVSGAALFLGLILHYIRS